MKNELAAYDKITEELVILAQDYEIPQAGKHSFPQIVHALREAFKNPETHKAVFGNYLEDQYDFSDDYCLVSHYLIYLKCDGQKVWNLMKGTGHWWLEHREISGPYDITKTQHKKPFNYRTKIIEKRIQTDPAWTRGLHAQAMILSKQAGLE